MAGLKQFFGQAPPVVTMCRYIIVKQISVLQNWHPDFSHCGYWYQYLVGILVPNPLQK